MTMNAERLKPCANTVAVLAWLTVGCDRPTAPSAIDHPPPTLTPPYRISGTVTAYRGGALSGISVSVYPCDSTPCFTVTDTEGHYRIPVAEAAPTPSLSVFRKGFQTAWKSRVTADDPVVNFILHPEIDLKATGDTVSDSISGDEFVSGDDVLFSGVCRSSPCKTMMFAEFSGNERPVELRLRWNDPTRHLVLYKYHGDPDSIPSDQRPPQRFTGSSEVVASVRVSGYFDALAVAFEEADGEPPLPNDTQPFELSVRPIQ